MTSRWRSSPRILITYVTTTFKEYKVLVEIARTQILVKLFRRASIGLETQMTLGQLEFNTIIQLFFYIFLININFLALLLN